MLILTVARDKMYGEVNLGLQSLKLTLVIFFKVSQSWFQVDHQRKLSIFRHMGLLLDLSLTTTIFINWQD